MKFKAPATGRLPCTLTNVLRRDGFRCGYCGGPAALAARREILGMRAERDATP